MIRRRALGCAVMAAAVAASGSWLGCNAILGIEPGVLVTADAATGPEASTEGGGTPDAPGPSNDAGSEREVDAFDPSLALLTCVTGSGAPRALENAPNGFERLAMQRIAKGTRIIATKHNVKGFTVLTYELTGSAVGSDVSTAGQVLAIERLPGAWGVLTFDGDANNGVFSVWTVDDATDAVAQRALTARVDLPPPSNATISGAFMRLGADDYLFAVGYPDEGTANAMVLAAGRRRASDAPVDLRGAIFAKGLLGGAGQVAGIAHAGTRAYVFDDNGPSPTNPTGTSFYDVPDTGASTVVAPKAVGAAPGRAGFVLATGAGATPSTYATAAASVDVGVGAAVPAVLHIGDVPSAKVGAFAAEDVPGSLDYVSFNDAPFGQNRGGAHFDGNGFLAIGPGLAGPGLNMLWYDAKIGAVRAKNAASNRLLSDHTLGPDDRAAVAFHDPPLGPAAQLDVVWTERPAGDAAASGARTLWAIDARCTR